MPGVVPDPEIGSYGQPIATPVRPEEAFIPPHSNLMFTPTEDGGIYTERVGSRSPWVDTYGMDGSVAHIPFRIPSEHRSSFFSRWMGYNYVQGAKLKRVLPIVHPYWEHLRCRKFVNVQGINFTGETPREPLDLGAGFDRPKYAPYDQIHGIAVFEAMPFHYKTDEQITEEYERNLWVRPEPGYESLYLTGGSKGPNNYLFDNSITVDGVTGKVAFPAGRNIPLAVQAIRATWYDVPLDFLVADPGTFFYDNLLNGIGKINDAEFLGFPAYTLYADPPQIVPRPNPLPIEISTEQQFLCNVEFIWHYFEPSPLGDGVATNLGHNMAPSRFDQKWYPVSIGGDGTTRLFQTYDFRLFFRRP